MFKEVAAIDNQHEPILQGFVVIRMAHHQLGLFPVIVHFSTRDIHHFCSHNTIHYNFDILY